MSEIHPWTHRGGRCLPVGGLSSAACAFGSIVMEGDCFTRSLTTSRRSTAAWSFLILPGSGLPAARHVLAVLALFSKLVDIRRAALRRAAGHLIAPPAAAHASCVVTAQCFGTACLAACSLDQPVLAEPVISLDVAGEVRTTPCIWLRCWLW